MKRIKILCVFTLILSLSTNAHALTECDELVLTNDQKIEIVRKELEVARQNLDSPFVRTYSKILNERYEKRLLEECVKKGACTRDDVTRVVRQELEEVAKGFFNLDRNITRFRVYTTLVSGMVSSVIAYQYADKNTSVNMNPALAAALGGMLGTLGITALYSISAPLLENIQGKATQMVYSKIGGTRASHIMTDEAVLRKITEAFEGNYDRIEQKGSARLTSYLKSIESTFDRITYFNSNKELDAEFVLENSANRLAYFLRIVKDFYQDIPPDQFHVMDTVYTFYGKYAKKPEERQLLYKKTIEILKQDDPNFDRSLEIQDFYHRYLKIWLATTID